LRLHGLIADITLAAGKKKAASLQLYQSAHFFFGLRRAAFFSSIL